MIKLLIAAMVITVFTGVFTLQPASALGTFDPSRIRFHPFAAGFAAPVFITNAGDGSGRLFVVEQVGRIRIVKNGSVLAVPFLDIQTSVRSGGEQGLLALAFHPSYSTNGKFYVAYTAPRAGDPTGSNLILEQFLVSSGKPDQADPNSGTILLSIPHPVNSNHNGGTLAFGPDGFLYWSVGDGGGAGDAPNNAQNLDVLLGKILRIDVNHNDPGLAYSIPSSNPFFNVSNERGEIWAYGLRNPWRISIDRQTGDVFIGDVGQSLREEVDFQPAASTGGENYGWHIMEGTTCYNTADPLTPVPSCDQTQKVLPITEYDHSGGRCAITGGYIYRGTRYPLMQGEYIYGDYCSGALYGLHKGTGSGWILDQLVDTPYAISTFGEDEQGELYFADLASGELFQFCYVQAAVRADFDGDCRTNPSIYRPSSGTWFIKDRPSVPFGTSGDIPVPGDYNGDGMADIAVYRPSTGTWYVKDQFATGFGGLPGDVPVPGDYNGDGKTDIAIYRNGLWYVKDQFVVGFGAPGDIPVPGDYDGDGKIDIAVYRPSTGVWYIKDQLATGFGGVAGDIPVPADYDGDGKTDIAIYRNGMWYVKDQFALGFGGVPGDIPVPGDYNGDGKTDIAIYRNGMWYVKDQFAVGFGGVPGDYPLPAPDTNGNGTPYQ